MFLRELLRCAGYALPAKMADVEIKGISSDSRTVQPGELFVAINGLRYDASRFVGEAFQKGAVFAVCERFVEGAVLVVENAREALARLYDAWYCHPAEGMTLIGVTGTNGKTSTATMLCAILEHAGHRCGLIGTVECRLGEQRLIAPNRDRLANMTTPDPAQLYQLLAQLRDGGAEYVVMEVTSHALAFSKTAPLCFERAIFTNLTPDHLDLHKDMESYYLEKRKLFDQTRGAVISCLSPYGKRLADELDLPLWRLDAETVKNIEKKQDAGVEFDLCLSPQAPFHMKIPVPGDFSVENGALAAITAVSLGVDACQAQRALLRFPGVRGRMERVGENPFGFSVFLDYAHTADALEKLLRAVRGFCGAGQRVTVLFGCGGDRDPSKRKEMGRVASRLADFVILTSDNCRSERQEDILRDILKGIDKEKSHKVIPDRQEAIRYAVRTARAGDVILLAGKGHETYEIRGRERLYFSEKEIVEEAIAQRIRGEEDAD